MLLEKAHKQGIEISKFYMIGDNAEGDIEGANRKGWESMLVRTGLFTDGDNHHKHLAKYVVQDMEEALRVIIQNEQLDIIL